MRIDTKSKDIKLVLFFCAITYITFITVFNFDWTWKLYDELAWIDLYNKYSLKEYIYDYDWVQNGRFRPLSISLVYLKFYLVGMNPYLLQVLRIAELLSGICLFFLFLQKQSKIALPLVILAASFWLKSPPNKEQLRWVHLSEQIGSFFLLSALYLRGEFEGGRLKAGRILSYLLLVFAGLTKEPFVIFISLPALLSRKNWEALIAFAVSAMWLFWLWFKSHGYSAYTVNSIDPHTASTVLFGFAKDMIWIVPFGVFLYLKQHSATQEDKESLRKASILSAFGLAYFFVVFPKAWSYSYFFAPTSVLFSLAFGFLLKPLANELKWRKLLKVYATALVALFSLSICAFWTKIVLINRQHFQTVSAIAKLDNHSSTRHKISTNCMLDRRGLGFAVDLRNGNGTNPRAPGGSCFDSSIGDCCKNADIVALSQNCPSYEDRINEATASGMLQLWNNSQWRIYDCDKNPNN